MEFLNVSLTVRVRLVEHSSVPSDRSVRVTIRKSDKLLEMNEEQINQWLTDFKIRLAFKPSFTRDELKEMFDMYNVLTLENKPVTSCSSCVASVISRLKAECRKRKIL